MTELVNQLDQVAQELLEKAEKVTDPAERKRLVDLAQLYRTRAEQLREGITIEIELAPEIQPKS